MTTTLNSMAPSNSNPLDLEVTIICAKHLKNVNWRNGDLKAYVVLYLDSDYRLATRSDDSCSTRPVWNERFTLPVTRPIRESILTLEIFHSKVSETPKPLVGSVKFPLAHLVDSDESAQPVVRKLELIRPSGRQQGKIRVRFVLKERLLPPPSQDYQTAPDYTPYYYSAHPLFPPPPPPPREYSYYSGCYPHQPPVPPRPLYSRASSTYGQPSVSVPSAPVDFSHPSQDYKPQPPLPPVPRVPSYAAPSGSGPSAPVDYSPYDQKLQKQFGGLSLEEDINKKEREKRAESNEFPARENYSSYSDYRRDY